jgi:hypothetical protein
MNRSLFKVYALVNAGRGIVFPGLDDDGDTAVSGW